MATTNPITGDLIASRLSNKNYSDNYDTIFPEKLEVIEDNNGNRWQKCGKRCWLEVVEDGKVKCDKKGCTNDYV